MKLLQINSVYKEKSTGRTTYELEKYLEQEGWECYVAYSDGPDKEERFLRLGGLNAHRIHCRLARLFDLQGFFSPISAKKLVRYMEKVKPDVVHLRNLHDNYVSFEPILKYLVKYQIPTVVTLHDFWLFTGGCCFHDDYSCDKWITSECSKCPQAQKESLIDCAAYVQKKKMTYFSQLNKLAVIGVSQWATKEFVKSRKLPHAITQTIYNWIDMEVFRPSIVSKKVAFDEKIRDEFVIIGVATGWNNIKGLDSFIELSKKIDDDCRIILIGEIQNIQLPENIISIGIKTNTTELANCYSAADVFVSFSARETFGKVIAEAMSCGCPAVVYDITACGELVAEGCGYTVPYGNVDAAWDRIKMVKKNGRKYYQQNCVKRTELLFDLKTNAEQYNILYRRLCEK
jgi:glycosyltransferase involved in cell wall biosynthesis